MRVSSRPVHRPRGRLRGTISHDLDALRALYAEADGYLEGWTCAASADCCHFARTGREPYLWPNEWALLEQAMRARGVPRGSLPVLDERRCPLLSRDGRCTVYADRPFGCRTFFCARGEGPTRKHPRAELADVGKRVAALARDADPGCDGPRQLSRLLEGRSKR